MLLGVLFNSCKDETYTIQTANVPIYMNVDEWRSLPLEIESARSIKEAGQIYIYGELLFVVEPLEGIHIINNSNPEAPINLAFLPVYATSQISIRNDVLFTNSYFDILSIDISDPMNPSLVSRAENAVSFDAITLLPGYDNNYTMANVNQPDNVIIGWELDDVKMPLYNHYAICGDVSFANLESSSGGGEFGPQIGIGGSLARFTILNDHLYTLETNSLQSFAISNSGSLSDQGSQDIWRTCETIFPNQNHLFIGTTSGMLIYDIVNPGSPALKSEVNHIVSCDPVVVQEGRAYVTLSTGINCWGTNSLEVMNVEDFTNPSNITQYSLTHPQGLGVDGNLLFVCDDEDGLKIFDRTDDFTITDHLILHESSILSKDVIAHEGVLIVRAQDGIHQWSYADQNNFHELSVIQTSN